MSVVGGNVLLLERELSRQVCSSSLDLKQNDIVGHAPKVLTFQSGLL